MEALFVLLGLILLAIPVAVVFLLISHANLKQQVRGLNLRLDALARGPQAPEAPATRPDAPTTPPVPIPPAQAAGQEASRTPWAAAKAPPPPPPSPTQAVVFRPDRLAALAAWVRDNWFYLVAAVSLALAGVFLVQYGIEAGFFPPLARVLAALAFGAALIAAGEFIRRRFGDDESSATAYLPSVLSGAGIVSLFAGVLAARMLYDLIDPGPALLGLFVIALAALVLGWLHGPLLAAVGLVGGMAAPFLVGGESETPEWLYIYFALLAGLGLGIDTLRRWAWISVLALVLAFGAGWLLFIGAALPESMASAFGVYGVALVVLTVLIPARGLIPGHDGPCLAQAALHRRSGRVWPIFPARLSMGAALACISVLILTAPVTAMTWWVSVGLAVGLSALFIVWSSHAPALQDHAALPALAFLALLGLPDLREPALQVLLDRLAQEETQTEARMIRALSELLAAGVLLSLLAVWRSVKMPDNKVIWAGAAALVAPAAGLALDVSWQPVTLIGATPWALHALALAALMTILAERFAKIDGPERTRTSLAVLSALACLAYGLSIVLTEAALTLALAATVLAAAALDRKFNLPLMGAYITAGIVALGYRLVVDPGLDWAMRVPVLEMLASYGGTLAAMLAAFWLLLPIDRPRARIVLESAAWSTAGMTLSLVLIRVIETFATPSGTHWHAGLHAAIWAGVALAQLQRQTLKGWMQGIRIALSMVFGLIALFMLVAAALILNPLWDMQTVAGWPVLNTLIPAYLLPGVIIALGGWRLRTLPRALRLALAGIGGALGVLWLGLAIRHAWQGDTGMLAVNGVSQPELYSYTVALLLAGAGLFYQALARRSDRLRRAGVLVIGLAVAKVFLIDMGALSGLVRVFSFLLLGLSLAGLAWFNRWVQMRSTSGSDGQTPRP